MVVRRLPRKLLVQNSSCTIAPLSFDQWDNGNFSLDGIAAASDPSAIQFLPGPESQFQSCEGPNQIQTSEFISFVPTTDQYLLAFASISPGGDPANGSGDKGAAWFFATNSNSDFENDWSQPEEIGNSWEPFDQSVKNCD